MNTDMYYPPTDAYQHSTHTHFRSLILYTHIYLYMRDVKIVIYIYSFNERHVSLDQRLKGTSKKRLIYR